MKVFTKKNASSYFYPWIKQISIPKKNNGSTSYIIANNTATLAYLTNQLTIEYHTWLSRADKPNQPDRMIFDLAPPEKTIFKQAIWAAFTIKHFLEGIGLPLFIMTTGSRGLHIVIPLKRLHTFELVRRCAQSIGLCLASKHPTNITASMHIVDRKNAIFIDTQGNGFTATGVSPYSMHP